MATTLLPPNGQDRGPLASSDVGFIFLSYAAEDVDTARQLAEYLESRGWSVWWDRKIPAGRTFDEAIEEALSLARCVIVLWTNAAVVSRWVRSEATDALNRNILVPVLVEDVRIPVGFSLVQAIDLREWRGLPDVSSLAALHDAVARVASKVALDDPASIHGKSDEGQAAARHTSWPAAGPVRPREFSGKIGYLMLIVVPVAIAVIAGVGVLLQRSGPSVSQSQTGVGNVAQNGTGNVNISTDLSTKLFVTNISVIAGEYQKYQGQPLDDGLKRQIDQALAEASAGKSSESIRLLEAIASKAPLPAIYNNLGVEYAKAGQTQQAQQAFKAAIQRDPQQQDAQRNLALLSTVKVAAPPARPTSPAVKVETSAVPTIAIEPLAPVPGALKEVHLVDGGTDVGASYRYKYSVEPGNSTIVEPGTYDVIFKSPANATFVLTRNVAVTAGTLVRINPAALVGYIQVEQLSAPGFPAIKEVTVFEAGKTGYRLIFQRSEHTGELMPIVPGKYEVVAKTSEDQQVVLAKSVEVKLLETVRIRANDELGAFLVRDPKVAGSKVELVYVLRSGTNEVVAQSNHFGSPMVVGVGETYDIALKQPGGLAKIATKVAAKRGEVTAVP